MANKLHETLLIIGAGAHVPYSMPTSSGLRNLIKDLYNCHGPKTLSMKEHDSPILKKKKELCYIAHKLRIVDIKKHSAKISMQFVDTDIDATVTTFNDFLRSFCESHVQSIDTYLSNLSQETDENQRRIFGLLGKLTVVYLLAYEERDTHLGGRNDDWIHTLINQQVKPDYRAFFKMAPKIVTFNYDRIFERMLYTHLREYHKVQYHEAISLVNSLRIVHVYGQIASFEEWYQNHSHEETAMTFYKNAIESIFVIDEDRNDARLGEIQKKIRAFYESTSNIYFLGYGYDEINNSLLMSSFSRYEWFQNRNIYSTSIGIKKFQLDPIIKNLRGFNPFELNITREHVVERDCLNLLTELAPLEL